MKRIWGHRGEYYDADYTIGDDDVMRSTKVRIKGNALESAVIAAVAKEIGVAPADIHVHQIVRMDS